MKREGTSKKKEKTNSAARGFGPPGKGMFEMMSECCSNGGNPDCSTMMKGMMETIGNQSCCTRRTSPEQDGRER